ncbi:MAG: diguanylate cyclase [Nannocystaceae bacterium]|nr:diguanylate cyclase [Nannocystaceae bacterium]
MPKLARNKKKAKASAPICAVATKILQMAVREDCSAEEIGQVVIGDPALGLRVLALVNSSAFSLRNRVSDVKQAVALLGVRGLRNLALSLVVSDMAPVGAEGRVLLANSLRRALAAQGIARALGVRQTDSYFTAGLFLDVGLLSSARDDLAYVAEIARGPAAHRVVRERAAGNVAHPTAGAELAQKYNLPEETVQAIACHHDEEIPTEPLAKACWLAERFAGVFEGGDMLGAKNAALAAALDVGISSEDADEIFESIPEWVRTSAEAFDRDIGEQPDLEALVEDANKSLVSMNQHYETLVRQLQTLIDEKAVLETELRAANSRLAAEATTDELTGLPNKRALQQTMTRDLARASRQEQPLSLVVIDVDHFKKFNDTWGHSTGDVVLRNVGALLLDFVRAGDVPARYGGEEFVVVLPNTDEEGSEIAAERLRVRLEAMVVEGPEGPLAVTASFGVATVRGPGCEHEAKNLFDRADAALYVAKENGRNQVSMAA